MRISIGRLRKQAGDPAGAGGAPELADRSDQEKKPKRVVVCANCRHRITDTDARMSVAGRHQHTCVNPSGIGFRIGCYARAPGCIGTGEWTDYYSWFAGYFWQISCCGRCSMHLGWGFTGDSDKPDFHGLIIERVEELEVDDEPGA